ncbi:MAG TPA: hypothetical protein VIQ29_10205 [Ancylobacter sp.]
MAAADVVEPGGFSARLDVLIAIGADGAGGTSPGLSCGAFAGMLQDWPSFGGGSPSRSLLEAMNATPAQEVRMRTLECPLWRHRASASAGTSLAFDGV